MKKSIFIALLIIKSFSLFAEIPEEVQDLEKILWINCGDDIVDVKEVAFLTVDFGLNDAIAYYKYNTYWTVKPHLEPDEQGNICGKFEVAAEVKKGYYMTANRLKNPVSVLSTRYYGLVEPFAGYDIQREFVRSDGNPFNPEYIEGDYLKDENKKHTVRIRKINGLNYDGIVSISEHTGIFREEGRHLFRYDSSKNSLISDGTICNSVELENGSNDLFELHILKNTKKDKLLLLDTPYYTRPFIPMEDLFVVGAKNIHIEAWDSQGPTSVYFYEGPSQKSKFLFYYYEPKKVTRVDIIDVKNEYEEIEGTISKWIKIRLPDGREGWVWGRDCRIPWWNRQVSGFDKRITQRYKYLNIIKMTEKKVAVLNDSKVRLRQEPVLNSKLSALLDKGEKVLVNAKFPEPYEIDGESWYWYKVETSNGKTGWVYGKYLDMPQ